MTTPTTDFPITGWGYEGRTVDDLIQHTRESGAGLIIDVRLNAISRKRGFSKRRLEQQLATAGLRYLHLPALGNPRDNRDAFATPGTAAAEAARERFTAEVLDSEAGQSALRLIVGAAERCPVVLLCYEHDQACCHRELVLMALSKLFEMVAPRD